MESAVNRYDLWSVRVVCNCNHTSCWDDNLSRNQVFFLSGLNHQTQPSLGPRDFLVQQVGALCQPLTGKWGGRSLWWRWFLPQVEWQSVQMQECAELTHPFPVTSLCSESENMCPVWQIQGLEIMKLRCLGKSTLCSFPPDFYFWGRKWRRIEIKVFYLMESLDPAASLQSPDNP